MRRVAQALDTSIRCFQMRSCAWHAICEVMPAMQKSTYFDDSAFDPQPAYPTPAEIALAEELRHRLEQRYLAHDPQTETDPRGSVPGSHADASRRHLLRKAA